MTGGMTVMSLIATPQTLGKNSHGLCMSHHVKSKSIAYLQYQIALQQKLQQRFIYFIIPNYMFRPLKRSSSYIKSSRSVTVTDLLDFIYFIDVNILGFQHVHSIC